MQNRKAPKFSYEDITLKNDSSKPYTETINLLNSKKICICNQYNPAKTLQCFKCHQKVHYCAKVQINRPKINRFQCLSCLARAMDLAYQPQTILLETFFKTQSIFQKSNVIQFEFNLRFEDTKFPVDIRCLKGNKIELVWPMQGQFTVNDFKETLNSLKPLKSNSNRKNRKEECYQIDPKYLREGKNVLTFKIPRLKKELVVDKYQYEETGIYFIGIYSVKLLKTAEVLNITQRERRFEKHQTMELFRQGDDQIFAERQKVRLIDPYTGERIKFPVRGRYCNHLATVCLVSYVEFQKNSRSWKCPICAIDSNSFMNEPYVDIWFHEILQDNSRGENVFLHPNGTYQWETVKSAIQSLDSDDEDVSLSKPQNLSEIIEEEQAVIAELEIFDIESNNHSSNNQQREIDLIDYENYGENPNPQNEFWNHQESVDQSNGELSPLNENPQLQQQNFDARSAIGEPIIEEFAEINQDESDSLDFPFNNNDYVPASILQKIKVQPTPIEPEKKSPSKAPEIYTMPLEVKHKKYEKKPQSNIPSQEVTPNIMKNMEIMRQKILQKNSQASEQINAPNQPEKKPVHPKIQTIGNDKFIGDKRLIHRPTFIQTHQQRLNANKSQSLLSTPSPFGTLPRKNIELSQERINKSEPKVEPGLGKFFPPPPSKPSQKIENLQKKPEQVKKLLESLPINKNQQQKSLKRENAIPQKPKPPKTKTIKCLECAPISHEKFVKNYCKIPNPNLFKRMTQELKVIFDPIL